MLFSSLVFLFYFLPLALALYYLVPNRGKNGVLLFVSIVFYAWGGIGHTLLLLASISLNFFFATRIQAAVHNARQWLVAGIVTNVLLLVYYKYTNFLVENIGSLFGYFQEEGDPGFKQIVLPLGISFYTFHQLSMLRDIYRDRTLPKVTFANTVLYVSFFPQLVAGPIVRYKDIIYQIRGRKIDVEQIYAGVQRFVIGLFKKVVIANACASLADTIIGTDISVVSSSAAWLGLLAYTLQIYFDFSGYSDMAIGLAKLFGFDLLENFNLPYVSRSIKEFWRRWHISLSTWFRDYVYIPLGGSKRGNVRTYVNLLIIFVLTGFWHGASWNFLLWGVFHGVFIVLERSGWENILARLPFFLSWSYTMLIVMTGWLFFRVTDFDQAVTYLQKMWSFSDSVKDASYFLNNESMAVLAAGIVFSMLPFKRFTERITSTNQLISFPLELVRNAVYIGMFLYSVLALTSSTYNPFIYFNF